MTKIDPSSVFSIGSDDEFNQLALSIFRYQAENNIPYGEYISYLDIDIDGIKSWEDVPFMPVEFFRTRRVISGTKHEEITFSSSGTTGSGASRHFVADLAVYRQSFTSGFEKFYGSLKDKVIVALLPSYMERKGSSLIFMAEELIHQTKSDLSGFFLNADMNLASRIEEVRESGKQLVILGVTFALLDMAERSPMDLSGAIVMETGGMKGRRREITREEVHSILISSFNVATIHSEYGMTELLGQAYSKGNGIFNTPPWMRVTIRDPYNPFRHLSKENNQAGGIDIADLTNINSCSFISTGDIGRMFKDGSFSVLGRFDSAELRGCNLMVV